MSKITFTIADTKELREAAYRFRYRIYVEEMGRRQVHADHASRTIKEPQDEHGRTFVALSDEEVIGTVRGNFASDPSMSYYRKVYRVQDFQFPDLSTIQITTKLMIDPAYARTGVAPRLISAYALEGYKSGVTVDFIDCNRHLIPFFERLGYFSYCGWRLHKEYGTIRPMVFAVDTVSYLKSIGSFLSVPASSVVLDGEYGGYELIRRYATSPSPDKALSSREPELATA